MVLRGAGAITQGSQPDKPQGSVRLACPPNATNNITPPGTTALVLIAPPSAGDLVLGAVVADAVRGDTHLMVKKLPGSLTIPAGDRLVLSMSDTATHDLRSHLEEAFLLKGPRGGFVLAQLTLARGSSQLVISGNGLHDTVLQQMPTNFSSTLTLGARVGMPWEDASQCGGQAFDACCRVRKG